MPPLRIHFIAAAAILAVQLTLPPSTASTTSGSDSSNVLPDALSLHSLFGNNSPFDGDMSLLRSMSSLLGLLSPMRSMSPAGGASVSLSLSEGDLKSCRVKIIMGSSVSANGLKLGLNVGQRRVSVAYHQERTQEEHDPEKGDRRSSSSFHSSSSLLLPTKCIATSSVLLSNLAGYMLDNEAATEQHRGLIVFPSAPLLQEYIELGLLPESIISTLYSEDHSLLGDLTPAQLCLAAGFTTVDCNKLGNKKPDVTSVTPVDSGDLIPIPLYNASLQLLD